MLHKLRNSVRSWWRCRTKRCDYYRHYLAYGPPELTHEGYHAAERHCAEWQRNFDAGASSVPVSLRLSANAEFGSAGSARRPMAASFRARCKAQAPSKVGGRNRTETHPYTTLSPFPLNYPARDSTDPLAHAPDPQNPTPNHSHSPKQDPLSF